MNGMSRTISRWFMQTPETAPARPAEGAVFDAPRLEGIIIDGDAGDWGGRGLAVEVLAGDGGAVRPPDDLDARLRLGWDARGLLLLIAVRDDVPVEHPEQFHLGDSVELFVARKVGAAGHYQVLLSPGRDPKHPELRHRLQDFRQGEGRAPLSLTAARTVNETGYVLEVLLPWSSLGTTPAVGDEIGVQVHINDIDGPGAPFTVRWFPEGGAHADPSRMQRVRLAEAPSPPVRAVVSAVCRGGRRAHVNVVAVPEWAGKVVEAHLDGQSPARATLAGRSGRAAATLSLPMPRTGQAAPMLTARVDDSVISTLLLPDPDALRARALMTAPLAFRPSVFIGEQFPAVDFDPSELGDDLLGPHTVQTTFYDRDYNAVTAAERPGRYGAVIEIVPQEGRTARRYRTLYRQPADFAWWRAFVPATIALPTAVGVAPAALDTQAQAVSNFLKEQFTAASMRDSGVGALLAGLAETEPGQGPASSADDVWARDRQWWVGLKRRLGRLHESAGEPFAAPRPMAGDSAPVLRPGSPEEAGMRPDVAATLDAVCREWAADSDQAFAALVARRGVIVFHAAYGEREGRPMTVETGSWMASITKLLGGTLVMMLADQGRLSLDEPVDTYLPALRGIPVKTPLTLRHLMTHTGGFWGHWGDDLHDFDEIVAGYYPHLEVGRRFEYNGAGMALAGKVIEAVSGEALPVFFKSHLLDPLGMGRTEVTNMSSDAFSIPLDIAHVGQMLLNGGAYGDKRFLSAGSVAAMLPQRLTRTLGPDATEEYGIGTSWFRGEGLGERTFGHGSAAAATLRIDLDNELVVVMTRNDAGRNWDKYHPRFLQAVADGVRQR
ncbi:MAG: serine hydrolase [Armatimonadetes bacterium]|nr:serine hydrolase [Armatimonadota bacterium]